MSGPLALVDRWDVPHAAAAVVGADGAVLASRGPIERRFRLASISKLLAAYALLVAVEEQAVALDEAAGPEPVRRQGATLAHLLAHASGLGLEAADPVNAVPGARRIYSNAGIEAAADHLTGATGIPFETYLAEAVLAPLGMGSARLEGSPSHSVYAGVEDLVPFAAELFAPWLIARQSLRDAVRVQFPGLTGVLPGVGRFNPCDWGYGFERNFGRRKADGGPHWAGGRVSTEAFGHFGGAGTFFWVDPRAGVACICLTDRPFDAWAMEAWPALGDAVIEEFATR